MLVDEYRKALETGTHVVKELVKEPDRSLFVDWSPYIGHPWTTYADTRLDKKLFQEIAQTLEKLPEGFVQQKQVEKLSEDRRKMSEGALPINWGFAEVMAYGTLLSEGHSIRLTGQDVGRGTFSHRHAVRYNQTDGVAFIPLKQCEKENAHFDIYDSLLSEEAVLAFEYGYATTSPSTLVIWEAQFGDFANGAQVVIDQFISSGERKWGRLCGLTMLLPHGYEGQGPEHSSARLERYLQLCAEHNMQVCVPTTPSQIFHLLRRQAIRPMRRPLVIMSPKSLLRHPLATSTVDDLVDGAFATVIDEVDAMDAKQVTRLVFCSGKVYYDLLEKRRADKQTDTAIIRIEQLYPFPEKKLAHMIGRYKNVQTVVWCQEEPKNQGAWYGSQHYIRKLAHQHNPDLYLHYAGRKRSAAAAVGHAALHNEQQKELVIDALSK
jgi:2-oxoglutarate dehydrogenase E1 component